MAPLIPSAKLTLSYPLYGCDFDPSNSSYLVVGGGGGAGANGVGNKITLLDTSKPTELKQLNEVELRSDEDNVTSLAVGVGSNGAPNDRKIYAGINSSAGSVKKGKNEHFRVFTLDYSEQSQIRDLSKSKLFAGGEQDAYQRITRLSKPYGDGPQLGAVTTGLATNSELVLFDSSTVPPRIRGSVQINNEVVDVDFLQTGDKEWEVVYCTEHDIFTKKMSAQSDNEEPVAIYFTPLSDSFEKPTVPKFRALRWLTNDLLIALTNVHSSGGVVLQILRLPATGKGHARVVRSYKLPSSIRKAVGLAVSNLTPPNAPTGKQGYTQFVIAVAGQNSSISLLKVDLQVEQTVSLITKIKPFRTFNLVHPHAVTSIVFSNFTPPAYPVTASTPPQYLKLASVGASNTVVVYTLPLFPVPLSVKKGQSKTPRYVVALPSTAATSGVVFFLAINIVAVLVAILVQGALEIRGVVKPYLHATDYVPVLLQEAIGRPYVFPKDYGKQIIEPTQRVEVPADVQPLQQFMDDIRPKEGDDFVVLIEDREGVVQPHAYSKAEKDPHGGKVWEELSREHKEGWKKKLKDAGHWAEDMGETIFKGVLFGEVGGAIGGAVAGAMGG